MNGYLSYIYSLELFLKVSKDLIKKKLVKKNQT